MKKDELLKLFDYKLPESLIANEPLERRDFSQMMVIDRQTGKIEHKHFYDLAELLGENDVLVFNQSRVFPARLIGRKVTGGRVEVLLIKQLERERWQVICRPGLKIGVEIDFGNEVLGRVIEDCDDGQRVMEFEFAHDNFFGALEEIGQTPIPTYIRSTLSENDLRSRYQTVFAKTTGSAAAPTAGLHFTPELLEKLKKHGVEMEFVTLHVGLGTFQSLRDENIEKNKLHSEYFEVDDETIRRLSKFKKQGKRIVAVGTTTVRTLETLADESGNIRAGSGETNIFIKPPYKFKFVDSMITNFHLPKSSLLMLVSAFVSHPNSSELFSNFSESLMGRAYVEAIEKKYRFFSFGDGMLIK